MTRQEEKREREREQGKRTGMKHKTKKNDSDSWNIDLFISCLDFTCLCMYVNLFFLVSQAEYAVCDNLLTVFNTDHKCIIRCSVFELQEACLFSFFLFSSYSCSEMKNPLNLCYCCYSTGQNMLPVEFVRKSYMFRCYSLMMSFRQICLFLR